MAMSSRRRDQILEATRDLLLEEGLNGISMRKVALRVGVSATAIYRHYTDKHALLQAAVLEVREDLVGYFRAALDARTPRGRLKETGRQYLRFALRHPKEYQVLFMAWDQLPVDLPNPCCPERHTPTFRFLLERVQDCARHGLLPADADVFAVAMLSWSVCHGLASLYLTGGGRRRMSRAQFEKIADDVIELTLDGLLRTRPVSHA
jgi:AcrR family transcriptional regulator